jgi:enoyl-CoA hydratase/carnithine racemase
MILTSREERVFRVTLNNPAKRNALNLETCERLLAACAEAGADPKVGCILLDAAGPVFCAGMDLDDATAPDAPARTALHEPLFSLILDSQKPIVAAVQGGAFGGGLGLVANAHVALAAQGTQFGLTEMRLGLWPFLIYRAVSHAVGERRATELSLTARLFGTTEALQFGLIHEVTPAFELEDRAAAIARGIANSSPVAVAAGLDLVRRSRHLNWQDAVHLASEMRNQVLPGPDFAEGVRAFREKRRPDWPSIKAL